MEQVDAIKLPKDFDVYKDINGEKENFLEPVSKINIFVGSNNSGKSRFMRILSKQANYDVLQETFNIKEVKDKLAPIIKMVAKKVAENKFAGEPHGFDKQSVDQAYSHLPKGIRGVENLPLLGQIFERWVVFNSPQSRFLGYETMNAINAINQVSNDGVKIINNLPAYSKQITTKKVYIPTLRGLRHLTENPNDLYADRTIKDYFQPTTKVNPEVFTGLTFYERLTDLLLGNNSERRLINQYQDFISKTLFEGKSIALIPNQKSKVVIVKIGNEKERPIYDLGDGIQSAIILSFLPFVMEEETFFFIEEPEMYLHPGLQRKLLNFYNSREQHRFFLTTHSNHFLDITIDIKDVSIFTFRKLLDDSDDDELTANFTIEAVDSGCESSLELLGVRNSSVFLVNATIWVEGITDRWYLRKMFNSYMDYLEETDELKMRLEEDTHYSFVEYGGANITHWSFLDYEEHPIEVRTLCAKAIVIIDKDGEKKEKRKEDLEKVLGKRLIILPCREVENLLPYKVIKEVVEEYEKNDALVLKEYDYNQYKDVYLGKFIEDTMLKKNPSRKGGYKTESGTLKNKVDFCERASNKIQYEDLPESTQEIIKNIYDFIRSQNS